ncbi:hypothetical protein TNCV_4460781 [Trichonephila clavipes]|nr:hypothetical protein TNCV_4460781 [Trichonephila clavipes]
MRSIWKRCIAGHTKCNTKKDQRYHSEICQITCCVVVVTNATCLTKSDQGPRSSSPLRARIFTPVVSLSFEHEVTARFCSVPHQFRGRKPWGWPGASHLSSASPNHTRGLAARRLFRVPPCRKDTIHLQTSMSSPGFEPSTYGTAVNVANHYTSWANMLYKIKRLKLQPLVTCG